MPSEWKHTSLRDAGVTLVDCDHRTPPAVDSGFPYVSIPQLRQGRIEIDDARKITAEHFEEWTRKAKPQAYDVVLSRRCNPGETAFVAPHMEFALGQNLVLLRADGTNVYPPFLRWLVRSPDWWGEVERFINVGAVFNSLKCADIPKFVLPIPELAEQQPIADTLGSLDDKIALLRETNATLEAIAKTLFKSWFVDFDPVRAKRDGRGPEGMPPEVADLFPGEFEDSALGEIPKGWRAERLDEACEINPSRRVSKGVEALYLEMSAIPTTGHRPEWPVARAFSSGTKFINGDTLLARITPCLENGKTAFVDFLPEATVGWGSTEYIVLRPKSPLPHYWAYLLCRYQPFRQFAIQAMVGTSGRQRVEVSRLAQYLVAVPDERVANAFASIVEPLRAKIAANDEAAKSLAALRDTLLPRLMSGKLRIPQAEALTEEVTA